MRFLWSNLRPGELSTDNNDDIWWKILDCIGFGNHDKSAKNPDRLVGYWATVFSTYKQWQNWTSMENLPILNYKQRCMLRKLWKYNTTAKKFRVSFVCQSSFEGMVFWPCNSANKDNLATLSRSNHLMPN